MASSDRPSRRLHAPPASAAPGCAVPASGPPDCLRKLRQTGSVAFVPALAPPLPPALRHGALRPRNGGQGLAAPQRAAPCRNPAPPAAPQPARVASAGLGSLRCRLRGATGRLGCRPACRVPARRCALMRAIPGAPPSGALRASKFAPGEFVPPPIVCGFGRAPVRPAQPGLVVGNGTYCWKGSGPPESGQALWLRWSGITLAPVLSLSR